MQLITLLLRYSRTLFFLVVITGVISGISNTAIIALINTSLTQAESSPRAMARAFIALCVLLPLSRFASQALLARLAQGTIYKLRMKLCHRVLSAPLRQMEELGIPRLLATLTDDLRAISDALISIPILCIMLAVVIGCLSYLAWLSPMALLLVLAFMGVGIATYQLLVMKGTRFFRLARDDQDALFNHLRSLTEGAKELKLHRERRKEFFSKSLRPAAESFQRHNVSGLTMYAIANSWGQVLLLALIGMLLFVLFEINYIDIHILTGYILVLLSLVTPLDVILNVGPQLARANVALKNAQSLGLSLTAGSAEGDTEEARKEETPWHRLDLVGVTHTYYREEENGNFNLGPIDLTLRPGELVFLTGGNGSGKTTLAKLITGLYAPEAGEICVDGKPVADELREDYRQYFSVVFSDFYLFESLLGLDSFEMDSMARDYLIRLQLDRKVRIENKKLSTTNLSQGQRKRLALLTAYLEDRPIYLFDEWAADQDPLFKEVFYLHLLPELKARNKTVLVISHDDHYYHVADRLIKLDYGKIEYDRRISSPETAPIRDRYKVG